jgi:hypothetical protein
MSELIITLSCARDRLAAQDAIRDTWRPMLPKGIGHVFLLGNGNRNPSWDEWIVEEPDDYPGHQAKYRAAIRKALDRGFLRVFLSCIDTYVSGKIIEPKLFGHDYVGRKCDNEHHASGGAGYWLSAPAMRALATGPVTTDYADRADSDVLLGAGFVLKDDPRFGTSFTKHLSRGTGVYDPQWMRDTHKKFMEQPLE